MRLDGGSVTRNSVHVCYWQLIVPQLQVGKYLTRTNQCRRTLLAHTKRPATTTKQVFIVRQYLIRVVAITTSFIVSRRTSSMFRTSSLFLGFSWFWYPDPPSQLIRLTADDGHGIKPSTHRRLRSSDSLPQMDPIRRNHEHVAVILRHRHFISSTLQWDSKGQRIVVKCGKAIDSSPDSSLPEERIRRQIRGPFKSIVSGTLSRKLRWSASESLSASFTGKLRLNLDQDLGDFSTRWFSAMNDRLLKCHLGIWYSVRFQTPNLSLIFDQNELQRNHSLKRISHKSACGYPIKLTY